MIFSGILSGLCSINSKFSLTSKSIISEKMSIKSIGPFLNKSLKIDSVYNVENLEDKKIKTKNNWIKFLGK